MLLVEDVSAMVERGPVLGPLLLLRLESEGVDENTAELEEPACVDLDVDDVARADEEDGTTVVRFNVG